MATAWCYGCGGDHIARRGKNCKREVNAGYKRMPTRRDPLVPDQYRLITWPLFLFSSSSDSCASIQDL